MRNFAFTRFADIVILTYCTLVSYPDNWQSFALTALYVCMNNPILLLFSFRQFANFDFLCILNLSHHDPPEAFLLFFNLLFFYSSYRILFFRLFFYLFFTFFWHFFSLNCNFTFFLFFLILINPLIPVFQVGEKSE